MNEEKIVKINGVQISKVGFKNLQFETSRYSDGLNTIRGFGDMLNESNLSIVETVSIDFVLNHYELTELAYVYSLFKANGILPIENEYLLKKVKSTYEQGKNEDEISKDVFIKENITHLICFLQSLNITSIEKTNNSYKVNMILTLYNNTLTQQEYDEYIKLYDEWIKKTDFENICKSNINEHVNNLQNYSNINMKFYNVETLNTTYKEHLLNTSSINKTLNLDTEKVKEEKAQSNLDKSKVELLKNKKTLDIEKLGIPVIIPNHSILQIELITNNNISNVPIKGSPIGLKSYLGIGKTHFSAKLIFNEYENNIVEQLKKISDKNIVNHKVEIDHPLIQLFDFYTSNILNITFNNLEEANGIMVNIIFSLNGFRYANETTINTNELFGALKYDNDYKQEEIGGLYLEYVADYLYRNRRFLNYKDIYSLANTVLESLMMNQNGKSDEYNANLFSSDYHFLDFLCSYSSFPTTFGTHAFDFNIQLCIIHSLYSKVTFEYEYLNDYFNKKIDNLLLQDEVPDFLFLKKEEAKRDSQFKYYRGLFYGLRYYSYVDNISAISLLGNNNYKNAIMDLLYSDKFTNYKVYNYIMNDTIKKITIELFNSKQNGDENIYRNEVYKKLYEEFLYRLFYNLNIINVDLIEEVKGLSYTSSNGEFIQFDNIYKSISIISDTLYETFIKTFYDGVFIERITREIIDDNLNLSEQEQIKDNIEDRINDAKDNIKTFILEFESEYEFTKEQIKHRTYNIFLTKLNYFLMMRTMNCEKGNAYEDKFRVSIDEIIRIFILSSSIHSILLTRTSTRTDHFEKHIILGCKNIGYKISTYNSRLKKKNIFDLNNNIIDTRNVMFYEVFNPAFFGKELKNQNPFFHYKTRIKYNDFLYEQQNVFDNNPNKDINFFYGKKIPQCMLYRDLLEQATPLDFKTKVEDMNVFINEHKNYFVKNEHRDSGNKIIKEEKKMYTNELNVNNIKFPFMNLGFIPSHYTELFYGYESKYLNSRMKQRIIGNIDPFKNLEKISNIVLENENYVIPDYDICIYKKEYSGDYQGEVFKTINRKIYMFLKNASSISVVKNPKTKIKTMTIVLNNTSKSIFNFNVIDGSFDMKSLYEGKIDIVHIEPGDEIRVRIGFDNKVQIFNGFINVIENNGNQLILQCSSFASLLYNEKISELNMIASSSVWKKVNKIFKSVVQNMKTTLQRIPNEEQVMIRNLHNVTNPLNDHLFTSFKQSKGSKEYYNEVFGDGEKATMYTAFNIAISSLKTNVAEKFIKSKVSDITQNKIIWETYLKRSLRTSLGSSALDYQSSNSTYDIYTNVNNVDRDYETYGLYKFSNDGNPISLNSSFNSSIDNKEEKKDNNIFSNDNTAPKRDEIEEVKENTDRYGVMCLPVEPKTNLITSLYKERRMRRDGKSYREHSGIDICCNNGSSKNIYSVEDGIVIYAAYSQYAGNCIKIKHKVINQDKYYISAYMHLKSINVKMNQKVNKHDLIGIMGNTGSSSGEHLHFEMYTMDNHLDKNLYLNPFDKNMLPRHNWQVAWNLVNIFADNGQYTEEWAEAYSKSKKTIDYMIKNGGK